MWRISGRINFSIANVTAPFEPGSGNRDFAPRRARGGPAHDRRRTDVQITQIAKDLAEAVELLFQKRLTTS